MYISILQIRAILRVIEDEGFALPTMTPYRERQLGEALILKCDELGLIEARECPDCGADL